MKYIDENGEELDEMGQTHNQVCAGSLSIGGITRPYSLHSEFLKVKFGQICEGCQKIIDEELESWEVKAKEHVKKKCFEREHGPNGNISGNPTYDRSRTILDKCCGDKYLEKNGYEDIEPCEICGQGQNNNRPNSQPIQFFLPTLSQVQNYFRANNIHSITNQNGNLVIVFNTNTNTTPPSQTITDEELSETSTLMETEQKTM
jgi:hypothetical protein